MNKIDKIHSADSVDSVRDPYSSKTHRRIDIILIVLTILLIVFAFRYSAHSRTDSAAKIHNRAEQSQTNH